MNSTMQWETVFHEIFVILILSCISLSWGGQISDADWSVINTGEFPGTDGEVLTAVWYKEKLIIGGSFKHAGNVEARNLAIWDGKKWNEFGQGASSRVYCLLCDNKGNLYAGGEFDTIGELGGVRSVAVWNGNSWNALGTGLNTTGTIRDLVLDSSGSLYACGMYDWHSGSGAQCIAKWDGKQWVQFGRSPEGMIYTMAFNKSGDLYVGGSFDSIGDISAHMIARWDGTKWDSLSSNPFIADHDRVYTLTFDTAGNLYAGGDFNALTGLSGNLAKWDGKTWSSMGADGTLYTLRCDTKGNLFAGGEFSSIAGVHSRGCARYNGRYWWSMGTGIDSGGSVSAFAFGPEGKIFLGGSFKKADSIPAYNVVQWDGNSCSMLGKGIDRNVYALTCAENGHIILGGDFNTIDGKKTALIAEWNAGSWQAFNSNLTGTVNALARGAHGALYAGGFNFFPTPDNLYKIVYSYLVQWNGKSWISVEPKTRPGYGLYTLTMQDSTHFYAGGTFYYDNSAVQKWNGTTWDSLSSGLHGLWNSSTGYYTKVTVRSLIRDGKGNLFVGGVFDSAKDGYTKNIAKWDGNAWSSLGTGVNGYVFALACDSSGNLYAGGNFSKAGNVAVKNIAKWNGTSWDSLKSGVNKYVYALACDDSGHLYAGGNFDTVDGMQIKNIAKWDDSTWSSLGSGTDGTVRALVISIPNLFVGGEFDHAGGQASPRIAAVKINNSFSNQVAFKACTPSATVVRYRYSNGTLHFLNVYHNDRISLYSLSGSLIRSTRGETLKIRGIARQTMIIRVTRQSKIVYSGLLPQSY